MNRYSPQTTFADLEIPFPLYAAPIQTAGSNYIGASICGACQETRPHCFDVDVLIISCPGCDATVGIGANRHDPPSCDQCGEALNLAWGGNEDTTPVVCYDCLRAGKGAFATNTYFGMVTWKDAVEGITQGVPGLNHWISSGYELVKLMVKDEHWYGVRLPSTWLWELIQTPKYSTWQGEAWRFCCHRPMVYIGEWTREDYHHHAPDGDGKRFFLEIAVASDSEWLWSDGKRFFPEKAIADSEWLWDAISPDAVATHTFHCPICNKYLTHYEYA